MALGTNHERPATEDLETEIKRIVYGRLEKFFKKLGAKEGVSDEWL
jgi:hypothetical protein